MKLKGKTIKELQNIIKKDYGSNLSEEKANELGVSLLKLTKLVLNFNIKKRKDK